MSWTWLESSHITIYIVIEPFISHHTLLKVPPLFTAGSLYIFLQESGLFVEFEMLLPCAQYLQPVRQGEQHMGKDLKAHKNKFKRAVEN